MYYAIYYLGLQHVIHLSQHCSNIRLSFFVSFQKYLDGIRMVSYHATLDDLLWIMMCTNVCATEYHHE
jgi:hypothetical protein